MYHWEMSETDLPTRRPLQNWLRNSTISVVSPKSTRQTLFFDDAVGRDDQHDDGPRARRDDLDPLDLHRLGGDGGRDGRALGVVGEGLGRVLQEPVGIGVAHVEERVDLALLLLREGLAVHELVDVDAVAQMGGHPPRRGVGLFEQPHVEERRHIVADGGGGHLEVKLPGDRLGSDGLPRLDIGFDDGRQDLQFSNVELHRSHLTFPFPAKGSLALIIYECQQL